MVKYQLEDTTEHKQQYEYTKQQHLYIKSFILLTYRKHLHDRIILLTGAVWDQKNK